MSVPLLLTVCQGLCASTQLRVLVSSVSVLLASLEMEDTPEVVVRVSNAIYYALYTTSTNIAEGTIIITIFLGFHTIIIDCVVIIFLDVDECSSEPDVCVSVANCSNTEGGFSCQCPFGYIGDGRSDGNGCTGQHIQFKLEQHAAMYTAVIKKTPVKTCLA